MDAKKLRFKLLFLCTGNSARSIIAEHLIKIYAADKFDVVSAGTDPRPAPHPFAIKILREHYGIETNSARGKSWEEFADVKFDFIITLCDKAKETCPVWPGQPIIAHWGSPDPTAARGTDEQVEKVFWDVTQRIKRRLELFWSLPFDKLDQLRLEQVTREIGVHIVAERIILVYDRVAPVFVTLEEAPAGILQIAFGHAGHHESVITQFAEGFFKTGENMGVLHGSRKVEVVERSGGWTLYGSLVQPKRPVM